ncbi:MAG: co-chaperone DjlA [Gammaproteobacteria bacterium]|nr:co-chaperone DjlA [Gammaproteobacteria bacterium]
MLGIVIGGLLGLMFGGFRGLVIGAALGWLAAWWLRRQLRIRVEALRSGLGAMQAQFLDTTFAAMGALCKADSVVTPNEIRAAEAMFDRLRLSPEQRESAKAAFNRGKAPEFDLDGEVAKFARAARGNVLLLQMFLQVQLMAVAADGAVHPAEHEMLVRMARGLGLSEMDVRRLEALLRAGGGAGPAGAGAGAGGYAGASPGQRLGDAYEALGVSASASDTEIKRAYRRLMNENHPDKLASRGLPESMREIAEERTREISTAYKLIKEARGLA